MKLLDLATIGNNLWRSDNPVLKISESLYIIFGWLIKDQRS